MGGGFRPLSALAKRLKVEPRLVTRSSTRDAAAQAAGSTDGNGMAATLYLRDGHCPVISDANSVKRELVSTPTGYQPAVVCRNRCGRVVAQFEVNDVLAYRCPPVSAMQAEA